MSMLLDTIKGAESGASIVDKTQFMDDEQYHQNMYMLESALRELGQDSTSKSVASGDVSPYDADLRRIIEAVTLE